MRINKAIILAAGRGTRMDDLCDNTPKPLLKINNITLIESIILKLIKSKIKKIYVVVGYLNNQFYFLKNKYRNVKLILNEDWNKGNNITSLKPIKNKLSNSLIINGDVIIDDNFVFAKKYNNSCTYAENNSNINEWSISVDNKNNVLNFIKNNKNHNGLYQREVTIISKKMAKFVKKEIDSYNMDEYYEILILDCAKKYNIKFTPYIIQNGLIFDIDNKDDFIEYKNMKERKFND